MVSVENCEVSEGVSPLPHLFVVPIVAFMQIQKSHFGGLAQLVER